MTDTTGIEHMLEKLLRAAEMADRVSENISRANEMSRDLFTKATEKANILLEEATKAAEAAQDLDLRNFLRSVTGIVGHMYQVAQEVAPADTENLSEPQKIFQQLSASFKSYIDPMLKKIDPEGPNKKQIAMLGNIATMSAKTMTVCSKMISYSDKMNTDEKMYAVLGTVLMVAAVGILIAATVNPVTGPAVFGVMIAAFTLHALGYHLGKKSIERHVANEPQAKEIDKELDEVHADSSKMSRDYIAENRSRREMGYTATREEPAPSLISRVVHMFDFLKPKL